LAAFLTLAVVVPAASASAFKSPSLLNDASHKAAAETHGYLTRQKPPVPLQNIYRRLDYGRRQVNSSRQRLHVVLDWRSSRPAPQPSRRFPHPSRLGFTAFEEVLQRPKHAGRLRGGLQDSHGGDFRLKTLHHVEKPLH
jgi:hypothetical protein